MFTRKTKAVWYMNFHLNMGSVLGKSGGSSSVQKAKASSAKGLRARAMKVDKILTRAYGRKEVGWKRTDPLDTLMLTILSQNTNDVNRDRAYRALRMAFPRWEDVMGSNRRQVAKAIRVGGLANIKSERIIDVLKFINNERGQLSLEFLKRMTPAETEGWLSQMKGVGPKTRAIVMLFSLGMSAFPVDTHVHRVTKRIGLIGRRTSRERAQQELADLIPEGEYYNLHINLIEHGRAVCAARKPRCPVCPVRSQCNYHHEVFLKGQT
jgi:endonuclease-3